MGKSVKSRHYQKKRSWMETLQSAMYLWKWLWMEGLPSVTYSQKSSRWKCFQGRCIYRNGHGWKGFQARHIYRKVVDGKASKHDIFTEKGQGAKMGLGLNFTLPHLVRTDSQLSTQSPSSVLAVWAQSELSPSSVLAKVVPSKISEQSLSSVLAQS